jgi:hypothetical protein
MFAFIVSMWFELFEVVGKLLEMFGVVLMAGRFVNVPGLDVPMVLFSILYNGRAAKEATVTARLSADDSLTIIRGLSLVVVGITLQICPFIVVMMKKALGF